MYGHAHANVLKRAIRRSAGWKPLSLLYARTLHLIDRAVFRPPAAGPRSRVAGGPAGGLAHHHRAPRAAPSATCRCSRSRAATAGSIVIASNYGQRNNPSWYHNLSAQPARARCCSTASSSDMLARELEGDEREHWYERGIEIYPGWVQYRKRAPRTIPVIELSPLDPGPPSAG